MLGKLTTANVYRWQSYLCV